MQYAENLRSALNDEIEFSDIEAWAEAKAGKLPIKIPRQKMNQDEQLSGLEPPDGLKDMDVSLLDV